MQQTVGGKTEDPDISEPPDYHFPDRTYLLDKMLCEVFFGVRSGGDSIYGFNLNETRTLAF